MQETAFIFVYPFIRGVGAAGGCFGYKIIRRKINEKDIGCLACSTYGTGGLLWLRQERIKG